MAGCGSLSSPEPLALVPGLAPWAIPPDALETRRLFRMSYEGPESSGNARLVLELASGDAFAVRVFDRLGRKVWEARAEDGETLIVSHESESSCRLAGPIRWRGLEDLGPLPPAAVPALLLGRVPGRPPSGATLDTEPNGRFRYPGTDAEVWTGVWDETGIASWILTRGGEPRWWWVRADTGGILSQRRGRQMRWQLVTAEPLGELAPLTVPTGYREACAATGADSSGRR